MRNESALLFMLVAFPALAQSNLAIVPGPVQFPGPLSAVHALNYIQITNNTHNALTAPNVPGGTYGKFVNFIEIDGGPCLAFGAVRSATIASGGTGYVTGDTGTINGGSTLASYKITASSGVVTSITLNKPLPGMFGAGYSVSTGVATTATSGSGTGLTLNITGIFKGTRGPNCALIVDQTATNAWAGTLSCTDAACTNGDSVTLTNMAPAPSTYNGTYNIDITGVTGSLSVYSGSTVDTSLAPGMNYYFTGVGNVSYGMTKDKKGAIWSIQAVQYAGFPPSTATSSEGEPTYFAIMKSTDGGNTYTAARPVVQDTAMSCGAGGSPPFGGGGTFYCSYVGGALGTAPNGNLVLGYLTLDCSGVVTPHACVNTYILNTQYCNPAHADCTNKVNWSAPRLFPITIDPAGQRLAYLLNIFTMSAGNIAMEVADVPGYTYLSVSCDNGRTWSTGTGCLPRTNTLIAVTDPGDGFPKLPSYEASFLTLPGTRKVVGFIRNNIAIIGSGGSQRCFYPQPTCGSLVFAYCPDITAATPVWKITQTGLTPYLGRMPVNSLFTQLTPEIIDPGIGGPLIVFWMERDQNPNPNTYLMALTFDPYAAIDNPATFARAAQTPYLFYYSRSTNPSSETAVSTGRGTVAYTWYSPVSDGANNVLWYSTGTYKNIAGSSLKKGKRNNYSHASLDP